MENEKNVDDLFVKADEVITDESQEVKEDVETSNSEGTEESSTEQQPSDETKVETEGVTDNVSIKDIPGETPKERALRLEVTRLKNEKRKLLAEKESTNDSIDLSEYKKEEVENLENVLKKLGYVKKDELITEALETTFDDFKSQHPEYLDDPSSWEALRIEWNSGLYNINTKNPKVLKSILDTIHSKLSVKPINKEKIAAQQKKIEVSNVGSKDITVKTSNGGTIKTTVPADVRSKMIGYTDEELNEIFGK